MPQILGRAQQCCLLFCPENRSKNRDIVPGLAQYSVERVPTGSRIIIDTSGENKLTSATKRPSLKKKKQPCVAPDGLVNHEFSIGQSHARSTPIIKWQLMENCRKTASFRPILLFEQQNAEKRRSLTLKKLTNGKSKKDLAIDQQQPFARP